MSDVIGFVKPYCGTYPPANWFFCQGQVLPISEYETLFSIIGTIYGGDGMNNFALPDLRGRSIFGVGQNTSVSLGKMGGSETTNISQNNLPTHTHTYNALSGGIDSSTPADNYISGQSFNFFAKQDFVDRLLPMNNSVISPSKGGGVSHENMAPFLAVNYIICAIGEYPVQ